MRSTAGPVHFDPSSAVSLSRPRYALGRGHASLGVPLEQMDEEVLVSDPPGSTVQTLGDRRGDGVRHPARGSRPPSVPRAVDRLTRPRPVPFRRRSSVGFECGAALAPMCHPRRPHPDSCSRAYSRHGIFIGHTAQIRWAVRTPPLSDGKNSAGSMSRHFPSAIQVLFHRLSLRLASRLWPDAGQSCPHVTDPDARHRDSRTRTEIVIGCHGMLLARPNTCVFRTVPGVSVALPAVRSARGRGQWHPQTGGVTSKESG